MLSPEKIIEQIREDAPVVYNILNELYSFPITTFLAWDDWDKYYLDNPDKKPTADHLLELLSEYSEDNWDTHYWSGRYAQMLEEDKKNNTPIRVPFTESDCYNLLWWQTFYWSFDGVNLFLFNTDEHPELDPDSDEYDPSISISI